MLNCAARGIYLLLACMGCLPLHAQSADWIHLLHDQSSPDQAVREAAQKSLLGTLIPGLPKEGLDDLRRDLAAIAPALRDEDERVRGSAVGLFLVVSQFHEDSAEAMAPFLSTLLPLMRDSNIQVREGVFRTLGYMRPTVPLEVVTAMHDFVRDPDITARTMAMFVIARSFAPGSDDQRLLEKLLSDPQPLIRKPAVEAVALAMAAGYTYGARPPVEAMIEILRQRLSDPDSGVVRSAIRAIDEVGPPALSAKYDLQKIVDANADRELSQAAAGAIRRITAPPPPK